MSAGRGRLFRRALLLVMLLDVTGCASPRPSSNRPVPQPPVRGIGVLSPQGAPAAGCALYLYAIGGERSLLLVAGSSTGKARIMLDGTVVDLPILSFEGAPLTGFSPRMRYASEGIEIALDLDPAGRTAMRDGAAIDRGSMLIERPGQDSIALPVQGIVACIPAPMP